MSSAPCVKFVSTSFGRVMLWRICLVGIFFTSGVGSVCLGGGVRFVVMRVRWKGEGERGSDVKIKKKKKKIRRYEMW